MFGGMSGNVKRVVGSISYAVIGEPVLDQIASRFGLGLSDDIIKGLAGFFVSQNTTGIISAMGDSAVSIAAYKVGGQQLSGLLGNLGGKSTISTTTNKNNANNGVTF